MIETKAVLRLKRHEMMEALGILSADTFTRWYKAAGVQGKKFSYDDYLAMYQWATANSPGFNQHLWEQTDFDPGWGSKQSNPEPEPDVYAASQADYQAELVEGAIVSIAKPIMATAAPTGISLAKAWKREAISAFMGELQANPIDPAADGAIGEFITGFEILGQSGFLIGATQQERAQISQATSVYV